ncbi:hypothetical protein CLIB1423_24S00848 [[Candida] railenensis]|uniref:Protein kinase domain-containing protein n=1 Tax=[Candida] railenensis TaxID=45579 RepID=A0A9P0QUI4_9ASCO|nr:hypothetical protein CLIB1423_24S00848 [[Candida] railenensis]
MGGGETLNLSPNFEARFSRIDITPTGNASTTPEGTRRSPSKKYPIHIYPPPNTTPSKSPFLSTAKRAESRTKSGGKPSISATPETTVASRVSSTTSSSSANEKRTISNPVNNNPPTTRSFSFMRETSSSINKQVDQVIGINNENIVRPQVRHYSGGSRQLRGNTRQSKLPPITKSRRIASSHITRAVPSDITNYRIEYGKMPHSESHPHSLQKLESPSSGAPTLSTGKRRNRLPVSFSSNSISSQKLSSPEVDQPSNVKSMNSNSGHNVQDSNVYNRLYNNSYKRKVSTPRQDTPKILHRSTSTKSLIALSKIQTLTELYSVIYQVDPSLFEDDTEDDNEYTVCNPLKPEHIVKDDSNNSLSIYERGEVLRRKDIYYLAEKPNTQGQLSERSINIKNYGENFGFDDKQGNYVIIPNDHINYRYEILKVLGNGSFGNVVKCADHMYKTRSKNKGKAVAIKIIKNDLNWSLQAVYEIKMLKSLNESQQNKGSNILKYFGHFHFRGHMCIVSEILSLNLFSLLEISSYKGFSINILKDFSKQILTGLEVIHSMNIIHCDIKPENIMIKLPTSPSMDTLSIKIIDFGSSCFKNEISYSYIQSRYYRAPEVVLGARYEEKIDIWSFGCVLAELYTGSPLLPGHNELEQIGLMLELFGSPPSSLIQNFRKNIMSSIEKSKQKISQVDPVTGGQFGGLGGPHYNGPKIDERSIKKTLLFSLFDLEGKIDLQFLNLRLQAQQQHINGLDISFGSANSSTKRNVKLNSKILEVLLKVGISNENRRDTTNFIKFLNGIFQWDPTVRLSAKELLNSSFLTNTD